MASLLTIQPTSKVTMYYYRVVQQRSHCFSKTMLYRVRGTYLQGPEESVSNDTFVDTMENESIVYVKYVNLKYCHLSFLYSPLALTTDDCNAEKAY